MQDIEAHNEIDRASLDAAAEQHGVVPNRYQASATNPRARISLQIANLKEATKLIVEKHYLHRGRTMAQLPYWILLDGERVGVMLFAYPRLSVTFHGYRPMNVLELARLWIAPEVQGLTIVDSEGKEHTFSVASCAVGKALRRIRLDWHARYPHLPDVFAVVSWADAEHHEGTIYRAANFREVGRSGGTLHGSARRANGGRDQQNADYLHEKYTFLYEYRLPLTEKQKNRCTSTQLLLPGVEVVKTRKVKVRTAETKVREDTA